jgi:hypothetical protein
VAKSHSLNEKSISKTQSLNMNIHCILTDLTGCSNSVDVDMSGISSSWMLRQAILVNPSGPQQTLTGRLRRNTGVLQQDCAVS